MADYDILITGAGMVGLCTAKLLADQGLSVAVFDRQPPPTEASTDDLLRVSAISRASENILRHLDCWNETLTHRACAYEHMHVWDDVGGGEIQFDAAAIGQANLGHIVPNVDIQLSLWSALATMPNVTLISGVELDTAHWSDDRVQFKLINNSVYDGQMAIAADGAHSWLKNQAGIASHSKPYEHIAIVATVATELPHGHCARQVFLETGPLALLPTADRHQCSIVWSTTEAQATQLLEMTEDDFTKALQLAIDDHLVVQLGQISKRLSFPLVARHTEHYIAERLALVGDAAHTIHPLAGQGANIGLLDAASLAQIIAEQCAHGSDFYQMPKLRPYERWRRCENQLMLDAMAGFRKLFSGPAGFKSTLRSAGLSQVNRRPMLKRVLIETAMGINGDLPQAALSPMPDI